MTYKDNITAILECYFSGSKKEIIDSACNRILEQESCEDAISRQAAVQWIKTECNPYGKPTLDFESGKKVIKHLKQMPPVTPQPKTGHWINVDGIWFKCSECDAHRKMPPAYKEYYCPNCGTKMVEPQESEVNNG